MLIQLPPGAAPPHLLRRARFIRFRAAVLGILLHAPLALGVAALLEGRFPAAACAIALHLALTLVAPPALVLLPALPARLLRAFGTYVFSGARRTFVVLNLASLLLGIVLGTVLWAVFLAGP